MVLAGAEAEANGSRLGGVEWRRGGARGGGWRLRPPEPEETAARWNARGAGHSGSRGPLLGLPGRDGGGDAVPRGHVAAAGWMAAAGGRCPAGGGHVRRRGSGGDVFF